MAERCHGGLCHLRRYALEWPGIVALVALLCGCFLKERSPIREVHPKAELFLEDASEARFSPDGRQLALVRLEGGKSWTADIFVRDLETGRERRITDNPDYDGQPAWAPDSKLLVYTSRRQGVFDLFLTSVETLGERRLTWAGGRQPDFAPDGGSIVYTSDELGSLDLFLTSPAGGLARRLTDLPGREWFPRYSPNGRSIVYTSDESGSDDLWLLDRTSLRRTRLTDMAGEEVQAAWTPDSRAVVFTANGSEAAAGVERLDLYALIVPDPPGLGQPVPLTGCAGLLCQSTHPTLSPDGATLVFTTEFNPMQPRLARLAVTETPLGGLLRGR
jgi:Tol biopolymer transport system component